MVAKSMVAKRQEGQSIIEFALVLPLLLILLLGIVEFGFIFNTHVTLVHSAREGARYGAVLPNPDASENQDQIKDRVINTATGLGLERDNVQVQVDSTEKKITIIVEHEFELFDPIIPLFMGEFIDLKASAVMSLE